MTKLITSTLCFILFHSICSFAQNPPNELSGTDLRAWLKANWYDGKHTTLGYSGVDGARSHMYNIIDNHNDSVACVYSDYKRYRKFDLNRTDGTFNMLPMNCEHSIPQSFFGSEEPMQSDIHHLFPTYENWNSTRSNYPFVEIEDAETTKWMRDVLSQPNIPTNNIDEWSEFKFGFFEPQEIHKGNLARAIFYFYTMYPTEAGPISNLGDVVNFYQWHQNDPPDALEYQRDDDIFLYQGNANPYLYNSDWIRRAYDVGQLPPPGLVLEATDLDITLTWGDMPVETAYKVFRSENGSDFQQIGNTLSTNTVEYKDEDVVFGVTYFYYIIAIYGNEESEAGDTKSTTLLPLQIPVAINDLNLTQTNFSIDLDWSDASNESFYQIYRSTDNLNFDPLGDPLEENTVFYSDMDIETDSIYYYYIVAGNSAGTSTSSNVVTNFISNNNEVKNELTFSLAPIPAQSYIDIEIQANKKGHYELSIYNLIGQSIYSKKQLFLSGKNNVNISLNNVSEGIYFIEIKNEENKWGRKLIKTE